MNTRKCNKKRIAWMLVLALFASCLQPVGILAQENVDAEMVAVSANVVPVLGMLQLNSPVNVSVQDMYVVSDNSVGDLISHYQFQAAENSSYEFSAYDGYEYTDVTVKVYEEGSAYG